MECSKDIAKKSLQREKSLKFENQDHLFLHPPHQVYCKDPSLSSWEMADHTCIGFVCVFL